MKRILLSLLCVAPLQAMNNMQLQRLSDGDAYKLDDSCVRASHKLGTIALYHGEKGFHVSRDGEVHAVKNHWVDPELRNTTKERLALLKNVGYIDVVQMDDGEFRLQSKVRGLGGGPVSGLIAYWLTKSAMYGTAAVVGTATIAGATAAAVAAAPAAAAPAIIAAGAGTTKALMAGTTVATAAAGAGVVAAVGAEAAGLAVAGTVASAGSIAGAVAFVESSSLAAGAFFAAIPFLP